MPSKLGQVAYAAYRRATENGDLLMRWAELSDAQRSAWERVAQSVRLSLEARARAKGGEHG